MHFLMRIDSIMMGLYVTYFKRSQAMMYFFHIIENYFYGSHTYMGVFSIQRATCYSASSHYKLYRTTPILYRYQ